MAKKRSAKQRTKPPKVKATTSAKIDAELAEAALEKRRRGERPTRDELAALRRHEASEEERLRWEYYSSIPKKHLRELTGRATEQMHRMADSLGVPVRTRSIDLGELLRWLFAFVDANKSAAEADQAGGQPTELAKLRCEQGFKMRLENKQRIGELISREDARRVWEANARAVRLATQEVRRRFGDEAADVFNNALTQSTEKVVAEMEAFDKQRASIFEQRVEAGRIEGDPNYYWNKAEASTNE
jgi:phage terminase Nu1 subunit (DNA packaging protein)